ncbi:hypothetical protein FRC17_005683 [Serendipita sp. 399]|nr:hypothetical protein FRC17_005683 [Serendipita sp. 399]
MLTQLPPEIIQKIVILACPLISLSTVNTNITFTSHSHHHHYQQQQRRDGTATAQDRRTQGGSSGGDDRGNDARGRVEDDRNIRNARTAYEGGEGLKLEGEEEPQYVEEDDECEPVGVGDSSKLGTAPFVSPDFDTSPPSIVSSLSRTCRGLYELVRYADENAWFYSKIFDRSFDFGAAKRRLGKEWAGPHGIAWEGRKRWGVIRRMRKAIRIWERDGYRSTTWLQYYSESNILQDLWTLYFMLIENDGKNGVVLVLGARLTVFVEMLCRVFFGQAIVRRPGWPIDIPERALLIWILWAVDPSPEDFFDQDLYYKTKFSMRAFIFGSFKVRFLVIAAKKDTDDIIQKRKYSLGILPPNYFHHPSALDPNHWLHQVPPSILRPFPLNPYTSSRYSSWILPLEAPVYKYSSDPLHAVTLYGRTVHLYQPSLAIGALLWYFCGSRGAGRGSSEGSSSHSSHRSSDIDEEEERKSENEDDEGREEEENTRDVLDSVLPRELTSTSPDSMLLSFPSSSTLPSPSIFQLIPALRNQRGWTNPILFLIPPAPAHSLPSHTSRGSSQFSRASQSSHSKAVPISPPASVSTGRNLTAAAATNRERKPPQQVTQADVTKAVQVALRNRGFLSLSRQLEAEWTRRLEGQMRFLGPGPGTGVGPPYAYTPGSLQGTWEGGFLYLDFPEYAQFLTGERKADTAFYESPPEKTYGSNRQVWKLKEYELFTDPYPQPEQFFSVGYRSTLQDLSESIKSLNSGSTKSEIYAAITESAAAAAQAAAEAAFTARGPSTNQPLSIGRWKDGWLPPAERLEWRFAEDGSDELEIVEKIGGEVEGGNEVGSGLNAVFSAGGAAKDTGVVAPQPNEATAIADIPGSLANEQGKEVDEGNWAQEKTDMAGRLRGRPRDRAQPLTLAAGSNENPDTSATPVGRTIPLESPSGGAARSSQQQQQQRNLYTPASSQSPNARQQQARYSSPTAPTFSHRSVQPDTSSPPTATLTATFSRLGSPSPLSPPPSSVSPSVPSTTGSKAKPFIGEGRTFKWGWRSSKKKQEKERARASMQPLELPGLTDRSSSQRRASFDYDARGSSMEAEDREGGEIAAGRQYRSSSAVPPDRRESYDSILEEDEGQRADGGDVGIGGLERDRTVIEDVREEKVSKYVRWDPDADWARQAIWGPRPSQKATSTVGTATSSSLESGGVGKLRGHPSAGANTSTISSGRSVRTNESLSTRGITPSMSNPASTPSKVRPPSRYVRDVLVFGESSSSWGEATLRGRIRLHDGLVTLIKTYPQRATWVYTGYIIGGENFVGRWRDADSPEEVNGYEGPFAMKRRR